MNPPLQDSPGASSRPAGSDVRKEPQPLEAAPQHQLKPQLVWLGKFLGMDVYMDIQPVKGKSKHAELARRIFKAKLGEMN